MVEWAGCGSFYLLFLMGYSSCWGWRPVCWPLPACLFFSVRRPGIRGRGSDPGYDPFALGSEQPSGASGSSTPPPGWAWPHLLYKDLCCGVPHALPVQSCCLGVCLSHTPLTVVVTFLWSFAPSLPSRLSWNLWGYGSQLCLFPKLPRCMLGLTSPPHPHLLLSALGSLLFPPSSPLRPSVTSVPAESHCVCVSTPPTSHGPCSGPVVPSLSSVSSHPPSSLAPLCLETLLRSSSLGPCQSPS